jgi:hypothetical protein
MTRHYPKSLEDLITLVWDRQGNLNIEAIRDLAESTQHTKDDEFVSGFYYRMKELEEQGWSRKRTAEWISSELRLVLEDIPIDDVATIDPRSLVAEVRSRRVSDEGGPARPLRYPDRISVATIPIRPQIGLGPHSPVSLSSARSLLDNIEQRLLDAPHAVADAMLELMSELWMLRHRSNADVWATIGRECAIHPLRQILQQDPLTKRSFQKPRGYSGDAVMMDFIYSKQYTPDEQGVSELGERIFSFLCNTPSCAALRLANDLVASMIDQACVLSDRPTILSVASGHLREAMLSRSVRDGNIGRFVALDQDELSMAVVDRELSSYGIIPICNSIKALFRGDLAREKFDFIYSMGLCDYLDDRIATKLTTRLFSMLNAGGRLLLANFVPDIWGAAYMESFMDWRMIYRTPEQLTALASDISDVEIERRVTYLEKNANIGFLELIRG